MRGTLGGTCLNVGCIPSKALLHSSHLYEHAVKDFKHHGLVVNGDITVDVDKMMEAKAKSVKGLTGGIEHLFKKNKVDYVKGVGKLAGGGTVSVALNDGGSTTLKAKNVLIATGSEPTPLPPVPVDNAGGKVVDSTGALALKAVPKTMAVIGGGVIGLEMGSVWRRLGAQVTVIEYLDKITPSVDVEVSSNFQRILAKQGMKFKLSTKVTKSEVTGGGVALTLEPSKGGAAETAVFDVVLVATGRRPFTAGLGLAEAGVATDKYGRVTVDPEFKTNVPGVWAIGDAIDGPMLAHKAEEEGIAAVENIAGACGCGGSSRGGWWWWVLLVLLTLGGTGAVAAAPSVRLSHLLLLPLPHPLLPPRRAGLHGHVNYDVIPGVIYTYPEVATVGKTEEQLKAAGVKYNKGVFPFQANSRARAMQDAEGMVKILADASTDRVLGIHIIGPNAGEMIAEGVLGMEYGASSEDIARTCHAHPTLSEAFKEAACMTAFGKAIREWGPVGGQMERRAGGGAAVVVAGAAAAQRTRPLTHYPFPTFAV
jgi:dihydrolipoamide dehydrogenase